MRLSEALTGQTVIITKVIGHGSFRKRLNEMGFIKGKPVFVVKNAPLKDPVEYRVLGYNVSLRRSEASMIGVVTEEEAKTFETLPPLRVETDRESVHQKIKNTGNVITIALVGNPNCGKTSLFNLASGSKEHVGNYSGVTVDAKKASFRYKGYVINLIDLPGTYSITAYTPEEKYVRKFILEEAPDIIINVVDSSNLERNFYLTTQLIDMNKNVILALNMYDELEKSGAQLKKDFLSKMLGIPMVPTVSIHGRGLHDLFDRVIDVYEGRDSVVRHIHINYGEEIEDSVSRLRTMLRQNRPVTDTVSSRYTALRLLEKDPEPNYLLRNYTEEENIKLVAAEEIQRLEKLLGEDTTSLITGYRYGFISGALKETFKSGKNQSYITTDHIDTFLTHKYLGIPSFLLFLFLSFYCTFELGAYPTDWINNGVHLLGDFMQSHMQEGMFRDLLVDGIINGVGSVLAFVPNILILFFFISFMEDTGYMARAAFIMDKIMHGFGLHGRSFIPMVMGFGCNVPAIMATRTLRNKKDRILTMLIIPFMSCSARLPVYLLLISAFFPSHRALFLTGLYLLGIVIAVLMAQVFNKTLFRTKESPFVMELPPYRMPTLKNTLIHMRDKAKQYLKKIGGVILLAVIIVWALGYFPTHSATLDHFDQQITQLKMQKTILDHSIRTQQSQSVVENGNAIQGPSSVTMIKNNNTGQDLTQLQLDEKINQLTGKRQHERLRDSYLGQIGRFVQPVMQPLGFDWKMTVCLLAALPAKEIIVSTMGVLYQSDKDTNSLGTRIKRDVYTDGPKVGQPVFTSLVAFSFLIFVLIYFPCIGVIMSISRESGSVWWAVFVIFYTTALAWIASLAVYQIGSFFIH